MLKKLIDWLTLCICIIGYLNEFVYHNKWFGIFLGIIGLVYCGCYTFICALCPIKRDWLLVKGRFLHKVVNYVLLFPFVITLLFVDFNKSITTKSIEYSYSPKNLVYEDRLYKSYNNDTIYGNIQFNFDDSLVVANKTEQGGYIFIPTQNKLEDSISINQADPSVFWTVYFHFIDPGNQHMTTSETGRKRSALIAILGFLLLNGLFISTLISWFDRRRGQWIKGEIRYNRLAFGCKKVAIVIGANESTPTIIQRLIGGYGESPVDYVILLTNEDVENVREHISSYLTDKEERKVIVYNGQLDSIEEINKLHFKLATELYILGENSNDDISQSYHDTQNMKCVHNIASHLTNKCIERKIICRVLFEYQTTYSVFQFSDLPENIRQHLVFIPFNAYENWAQRVFVEGEYTEIVKKILPSLRKIDLKPIWINKILHPIVNSLQSIMPKNNDELRTIRYTPLDGTGITPTSKKHVHLVIVGMSKMGVAMAIQAAQVAHYPNFSSGRKEKDNDKIIRKPSLIRTKITFIDNNAENEMNFFKGRFQNLFALSRYRYIDATGEEADLNEEWIDAMKVDGCQYKMLGENFIDIEWEFVKGNVQSPGVMKYLENAAQQSKPTCEESSLLTIAICHPLAHEAIAAALYMPNEVYDNALQILVYQREASDIVYNLSNETPNHKRYAKLRPFGMQYADFTMYKENYYKSQLCNYAYCLMFDKEINNSHIPDILCSMDLSKKDEEHMNKARNSWKSLSISHKWSNRYLANSFETKLRSIGACYKDIDIHYENMRSQFENLKMEMAECEHNRWNVQQLLMGLRAYKDEELKKYYNLKRNASSNNDSMVEFSNFKEKMKNSPEKVHLNICSISSLFELDPDTEEYDVVFNDAIPAILKSVSKYYKETKNHVS